MDFSKPENNKLVHYSTMDQNAVRCNVAGTCFFCKYLCSCRAGLNKNAWKNQDFARIEMEKILKSVIEEGERKERIHQEKHKEIKKQFEAESIQMKEEHSRQIEKLQLQMTEDDDLRKKRFEAQEERNNKLLAKYKSNAERKVAEFRRHSLAIQNRSNLTDYSDEEDMSWNKIPL